MKYISKRLFLSTALATLLMSSFIGCGEEESEPKVSLNPEKISTSVNKGSKTTKQLTIRNDGDADLDYDISIDESTTTSSVDVEAVDRNTLLMTYKNSLGEVIGESKVKTKDIKNEIVIKFTPYFYDQSDSVIKEGMKMLGFGMMLGVDEIASMDHLHTKVYKLSKRWGRVSAFDIAKVLNLVNDNKIYNGSDIFKFAEPNYKINAVANDPDISKQWGLSNSRDTDIDAPEAWNNHTKGSKSVIVAVVDTGIDYRHEDLKNNMWKNPKERAGNGKDDDGNGYIDDIYGYDFANNDSDPKDDNKHGTHCAGIIGAEGGNSKGGSGVNQVVSLMALKFLTSNGSGSSSGAAKAIEYAADNGADIISASWGGYSYSATIEDAIKYAKNRDVLFLAASGNDNKNTDQEPFYPACYDLSNIISVGASDNEDKKASFSNYGKNSVDIFSPGVSIYSTVLNNRYDYLSGTSMATPFVAGTAALLKAKNSTLTFSQLKDTILKNGDKKSSLKNYSSTGSRLNANSALSNISSDGGGDNGDDNQKEDPNWLTLNGTLHGTLAPNKSKTIDVIMSAKKLNKGAHKKDILVESNDPNNGEVKVPVSLDVK